MNKLFHPVQILWFWWDFNSCTKLKTKTLFQKTCCCDTFTGPVPDSCHTLGVCRIEASACVASCVMLQPGGADTSCSKSCKHIIHTLSFTLANICNYFIYGCENHTLWLKECVFCHVFDPSRSETSLKQLREMSYALKGGFPSAETGIQIPTWIKWDKKNEWINEKMEAISAELIEENCFCENRQEKNWSSLMFRLLYIMAVLQHRD